MESHLAGGYVETPHFVKLRERSPTVPRIAKCIYVLVDHEISRWHRKKPPYRDYSHGALAEEFDCSVRTVKRAVAWLHANEWLYIERTGRANRYYLYPPVEVEDKAETPMVLIVDNPPIKDVQFDSRGPSDGPTVSTFKAEANPDNSVPDDVSEIEPPPPKEQRTKNKNLKTNPPLPPPGGGFVDKSTKNPELKAEIKKLQARIKKTPKKVKEPETKSQEPEAKQFKTSGKPTVDVSQGRRRKRRTTNRKSFRRPASDTSGGDRQNTNHPDYRLVRGQKVPAGFRRRPTEHEMEAAVLPSPGYGGDSSLITLADQQSFGDFSMKLDSG